MRHRAQILPFGFNYCCRSPNSSQKIKRVFVHHHAILYHNGILIRCFVNKFLYLLTIILINSLGTNILVNYFPFRGRKILIQIHLLCLNPLDFELAASLWAFGVISPYFSLILIWGTRFLSSQYLKSVNMNLKILRDSWSRYIISSGNIISHIGHGLMLPC